MAARFSSSSSSELDSHEGSYGSRASRGWTDEEQETAVEAQVFDRVMEDRAELVRRRQLYGDWCTCTKCFPPKFVSGPDDLTCCQSSDAALKVCMESEQLAGSGTYSCITLHPAFFYLCLYRTHLEGIHHVHHIVREGQAPRPRRHANLGPEELRYTAYKEYTAWIHGRLGYRNRVEIPQCVTKGIKENYPDPDEQFRGFRPPPSPPL